MELSGHLEALEDSCLRMNMGKRGRERTLKLYTLSKMIESYSQLLQSVMTSGRVRNNDS